jgi:hypothetical protein
MGAIYAQEPLWQHEWDLQRDLMLGLVERIEEAGVAGAGQEYMLQRTGERNNARALCLPVLRTRVIEFEIRSDAMERLSRHFHYSARKEITHLSQLLRALPCCRIALCRSAALLQTAPSSLAPQSFQRKTVPKPATRRIYACSSDSRAGSAGLCRLADLLTIDALLQCIAECGWLCNAAASVQVRRTARLDAKAARPMSNLESGRAKWKPATGTDTHPGLLNNGYASSSARAELHRCVIGCQNTQCSLA